MRHMATIVFVAIVYIIASIGCSGNSSSVQNNTYMPPSYVAGTTVIQEIARNGQVFRITSVYGIHRKNNEQDWILLIAENIAQNPMIPQITTIIEDGDAPVLQNNQLDLSGGQSIIIHDPSGVISLNGERFRVEPGFTGLIVSQDSLVPVDISPSLAIAWIRYFDLLLRGQDGSYTPDPGPLWEGRLGQIVQRALGQP